jgi:DNA-binding transcriptional regulator YdaS (Cro superfamily)
MDIKTYLKSLPSEDDRADFASRCATTLGHLKNVMYGFRPCATDLAVLIERESAGQVTRRELRPDWAAHWPELIGDRGLVATAE